ncbi:MAG: hypothetical protein FWE93_03145 [Alphaproteobacteria bacterium]|nr:hypothetical protein [Alphaproteobacteria bacterium]
MTAIFLKEEQIWGDKALDIIKKYGTKAAATDLAVLLGAWVSGSGYKTSEGDLSSPSWSASSDAYGDVRCVY